MGSLFRETIMAVFIGGCWMRGSLLVTGAALALASQPALSQTRPTEPIRIGVLDCAGDAMTYRDASTAIMYREFTVDGHKPGRWPSAQGDDHGRVVVTAAVRELRRLAPSTPIEVYSANAFSLNGASRLSVSPRKAGEALEWMSSMGVKVVVTAFNLSNEQSSAIIMDRAEKLGMTVFAAGSNKDKAGRVFPAADPRSISVADTTYEKSALTKDPTVATWMMFAMDGSVSHDRKGKGEDNGASYSSAKAGAWGAYFSHMNPGADRDAIAAGLSALSAERSYASWATRVTMRTLGEEWAVERIRSMSAATRSPAVGSLTKGPSVNPPVIAMTTNLDR